VYSSEKERDERELEALEVGQALDPSDPVWNDRVERDASEQVPEDKTVGGSVARYVGLERGRVDAGDLSPSEFDTIRRCLHGFRDWVGEGTLVEKINADRWEDYWQHLMGWKGSVEYKKKQLRIARTFVNWLATKGLIPLPPNLHGRKYRFGGSTKAVPTMSIPEVRTLVDKAPGQLRLHLLLMINTGMTQKDISDLRQGEVDWTQGRIVRKRSKTRGHANVPTVNYKLWPETFNELKRHRQTEGERVLLTEKGKPWVRDGLDDDGDRSKTDAIRANYRHLRASSGVDKPLKLLRKTSATLLRTSRDFGFLTDAFLGHAPASVADRNYAGNPANLFDEAVEWLGQQYGFLPEPKRGRRAK
jgi:integrase